MIGKLVVSLFVILCVLHRIDAACYIYPCDDKVSDAKCTNTTGKAFADFLQIDKP